MAKILDGIRILDFTQGHIGSYATMLLADFGAEVIKIEDPENGGDVLRSSFPKTDKGSAYHAYMNRGKKSICIDRNTAEGQAIIMKLIEKADVVCDCFPAGEMERCNIDYAKACEVNPGIIYASQTGFGKYGPMSNSAGCDLTSEAFCGLMQCTGWPDEKGGRPTAHGSRMADQFGGVHLAAGIVAALIVKKETGEGQQVEVASADSMLTALEDCLAEASMSGVTKHREGNGSRSIAPYDTFEVKDGIFSTAVSTNSQWKKFCEVMGFEELLDDPRFTTNEGRGEHYFAEDGDKGLREIIDNKFKNMTRKEISELLEPHNIPGGPGYTVEDAFNDEQLNTRNMVLDIDDKAIGRIKMPGVPIKISGIDDTDIKSAPLLGEDTEILLRDAGFNEADIKAFEDKNIVLCEGGTK